MFFHEEVLAFCIIHFVPTLLRFSVGLFCDGLTGNALLPFVLWEW